MGSCQFGPYEVLARLASGGAANVFLARLPENGPDKRAFRLVCLKTLLDRRANDDDFVAMFHDESKLGSQLTHPGCVRVEDEGEIGGVRFQAMAFVFGMNIWELLGSVPRLKEPLPPVAVARILAEACRGLDFAHKLTDEKGRSLQLIHRDISPQNIMITYEGQVKVVDFGVASAETGRMATATGIVKGKFSYMSPEQISGAIIDHRSDLYSMGIIMFECLASRRLYKADTPQEIAKLIIDSRPPPLTDLVTDIDVELSNICAKALAFAAEERFESAEAMAIALEEYALRSPQSKSKNVIKTMIEDRFGGEVKRRRDIVQTIQAGAYEERVLMEEFKARPVMSLDFKAKAKGSGELGNAAPRLPFPIDLDTREIGDDSYGSDHATFDVMPSVRAMNDPEASIATSIGDGISAFGATELEDTHERNVQPHLHTEISDTAMVEVEELVPFENNGTKTLLEPKVIHKNIPLPKVKRKWRPQTYTLGVVLTALMLGCCLGLALGLFLGRTLGF